MNITGFVASLFFGKKAQANVKAIAIARVAETEGGWTPGWVK